MLSPNTHNIARIKFGILSADEIKKMAVCKIDSTEFNGPGSVYDERMGCIDPNETCPTCNLKRDCSGHYGYIELVEPILHPLFYKQVSLFLWCFCKSCYRLLMLKEQIELHNLHNLQGESKFNAICDKISQNDVCPYCSNSQPNIVYKPTESTISMEYKGKKGDNKVSVLMTVEDIRKILNGVIDEDVELLGFDPSQMHPRNLILTNLPVIPSCSRPYVMANNNICDDDLTKQYREIVNMNNRLRDLMHSTEPNVEPKRQKLNQSLKFHVSTMMSNSKGRAKNPQDNRPLMCLKKRLAGKGGRFRGYLMGKRVNFSARTVIGADPTLKLGEFGVPHEVARIHTKPEIVTDYNIEWLTKLVNNGEANFLTTTRKKGDVEQKTRLNLHYAMFRKGTELLYGDYIVKDPSLGFCENKEGNLVVEEKFIRDKKVICVVSGEEKLEEGDRLIRDGKFVDDLKYPTKKNITLKKGDLVERHLQDGEIVLVNRQPTLHRGSMLAMRIKRMPYHSFRFNLAATKSFNADELPRNFV